MTECTTCGSEAVLNDYDICEVCFYILAEEEQQARDFLPSYQAKHYPNDYDLTHEQFVSMYGDRCRHDKDNLS